MENDDLDVVIDRLNLADTVERLIFCCWHRAHGLMLRSSEASIASSPFMLGGRVDGVDAVAVSRDSRGQRCMFVGAINA